MLPGQRTRKQLLIAAILITFVALILAMLLSPPKGGDRDTTQRGKADAPPPAKVGGVWEAQRIRQGREDSRPKQRTAGASGGSACSRQRPPGPPCAAWHGSETGPQFPNEGKWSDAARTG